MLGTLAIAFLAAASVGGVAYVFLLPLLSGERRAEKRVREVAASEVVSRSVRRAADTVNNRRQQVEESLKQLEARQRKARRLPLSVRLQQAGLDWGRNQFLLMSVVLGVLGGAVAMFLGVRIYLVPVIAVVVGIGLPRWILAFLKQRREAKFIDELPNAVDVIVRGVKAGLPLADCIRIIAAETKDPVKTEFRTIAEATAMGIPLADAAAKLFDRIPLPESNFFGIVISIQSKAGGSLSEALGNLSRVLRERKKMQAKIKAMSMEAKASAGIIAALPIAVMLLVYLTSPSYIELLWTTERGRMMLYGSATWMTMGVLVMRKMINFDF